MSRAHLSELQQALTQRGWQITEKLRGEENVSGAATWEIQRHGKGPILFIDFAGFGPLGEDISLEESYACDLRGAKVGMYFYRVNRSREKWKAELQEFVASLDQFGDTQPDRVP